MADDPVEPEARRPTRAELVKAKYGPDFYSRAGKKGGRPKGSGAGNSKGGLAVKAKYGEDHYARIGRKGGETVRDTHEPGYYSELGKKGGVATRRAHGPLYYIELGRLSRRPSRKQAP